jgi:hypothetical protein
MVISRRHCAPAFMHPKLFLILAVKVDPDSSNFKAQNRLSCYAEIDGSSAGSPELRQMLLSGRLFLEPRQHELRLEHRAGFFDQSIQGGGHPGHGQVNAWRWTSEIRWPELARTSGD